MTTKGTRRPVLLAPGSFKGTFSAQTVACAMEAGLQRVAITCDLCPAADGGDGTLEVLHRHFGGELHSTKVHDPLGRKRTAQFAILSNAHKAIGDLRGHKPIAVVEMAQASGLALLKASELDPIKATSYGTGELICAAVAAGAHTVLIGTGGSATVDGGRGALAAIEDNGGLENIHLVVLCDVRTPWELAAKTFGPQKGADQNALRKLERRLDKFADSLRRDPRGVQMSGCGGGLSGGLWATHNARLTLGSHWVLSALNFDHRMLNSRAVMTGEGTLDHQTLHNKLLAEIATRSRQAGVPCFVIVGNDKLTDFEKRILDLQLVHSAQTLEQIAVAAEDVGRFLVNII